MKNFVICAVIFGITLCACTEKPEVDCTDLLQKFDDYASASYLPFTDNLSLCYGMNMASDFANLPPKWAVGELLAIRGQRLTFEGSMKDATIPIGVGENRAAGYEIGKFYKVDMNNYCRYFFLLADNRYPSEIAKTFVKPKEINCKKS